MNFVHREIGIADALESLHPKSKWTVSNNNYDEISWKEENLPCPTKEEIINEIKKLNLQKKLTEYKELRKNEYPDIIEYIDGVVKGDQQQIQNYINKCLEVKKKYPKSEGTE